MKPIIAVPVIVGIVYRAWSRKSLTPVGLVVATLTAIVHAVHPYSTPIAFLAVFFLGGTRVTKVKHGIKAGLTISSSGSSGGEGPRNHTQVLANSVVASTLILLHTWYLYRTDNADTCYPYGGDILMVGIVANYAAVAADTYSSELGILSKSDPRLITSPTLRKVPRGTNGGVTVAGLLAGVLGAFTIALTSLLLPFCSQGSTTGSTKLGFDGGEAWGWREQSTWVLAVTAWGTLGSILDSVLGGIFQASVIDRRTGKVVEGEGGGKVLIHPTGVVSATGTADGSNTLTSRSSAPTKHGLTSQAGESRKLETGHDILDNNAVNLLMAAIMSVGAMAVASYVWNIPVQSILA